jgi:hypothetical protein
MIDNHQKWRIDLSCKLLRSFVLTECFPFFPTLGACRKYSLTTEPIRNMLKWRKQQEDWSSRDYCLCCETQTITVKIKAVVELRVVMIVLQPLYQFLGVSFFWCHVLNCCFGAFLHQKAEARDHRDLVSLMVVGTVTASFLGGEPLAINVNRFNPWCYSLFYLAVMCLAICEMSTEICQCVAS